MKSEQKQELEKLRLRWNLECATAQKNKVAYVLKRSRADYLRVMESENGLLQYQAEVLEITTGIGNQKEVAIVERERIVDIVDEVFSSVPEDTVLGKFRAEIQEEVRGVFSKRKVTPAVFEPEISDGAPANEIIMDPKEVPGPSGKGIRFINNKYVVATVATSVLLTFGTSGAEALPSNCGASNFAVASEVKTTQSYTVPADSAPPSAPRGMGIYIPVMQFPFDPSVMTDGWGYRAKPCNACSEDHQGIDFNPGYGAEIPAVMSGTVVEAEYSGSLGVHVYIDDGYGMITMYGHMAEGSLRVNVGDVVTRGQIIGQVGSTGTSTGAHLHFAIQLDGEMVNPLPLLNRYSQ